MRAGPVSSAAYERGSTERGRAAWRGWHRRRRLGRRRASPAGGQRQDENVRAVHHDAMDAANAAASTGCGEREKSEAKAATVRSRTSSNRVGDGARQGPSAASSSSRSTLVMTTSWIPQGTIRSKYDRSVVTFSAKPCQRHPLARVHADGGDLAVAHPDAGLARVARGVDAERREHANHHVLELAQVPMQVLRVPLEVDDRIADQLAGSVKGDVAAALDVEQLHAARRELLGGCEQVASLGGAAERDDRRMLDEEEHVVRKGAGQSCLRRVSLERERVGVGHDAEVGDEKSAGGHTLKIATEWDRVRRSTAVDPSGATGRGRRTAQGMANAYPGVNP